VNRRVLMHVIMHCDLDVVVLIDNEVRRGEVAVGLDHISCLAIRRALLPGESQLFSDQRSIATGQK